MQFNIFYIQRQVKKRVGEKLFLKTPLGSSIKYKRNKMNMTLEEAADGICSVSYLSKLENNLIEASDKFIEPLKERFNLTDEATEIHENYFSDFEKMIKIFFWQEDITQINLKEYEDMSDYQSQLMYLFYYTYINSPTDVLRYYLNVKSQICSFTDDELSFFLICMSIYLYNQSQHEQAYSILNLVPQTDINAYLDLLVQFYQIKTAFKMIKYSGIFKSYQTFVDKCLYFQAYHYVKEVKLLQLEYESIYHSPKYIEKSLNKINPMLKTRKAFILAKAYFYNQEYDKAIELSKDFYKNDPEWLILMLISLDRENKKDEILEITVFPFHFSYLHKEVHLICQHLWIKYSKTKDEIMTYLRTKILNSSFLTDYYLVLEYIHQDSQAIFKSSYFYKEAIYLAEQLVLKTKSLNR